MSYLEESELVCLLKRITRLKAFSVLLQASAEPNEGIGSVLATVIFKRISRMVWSRERLTVAAGCREVV